MQQFLNDIEPVATNFELPDNVSHFSSLKWRNIYHEYIKTDNETYVQ